MDETFCPPTTEDYMRAWSCVHAIETGVTVPGCYAEALAAVVYAAERARKLLAGIPTCAERKQL